MMANSDAPKKEMITPVLRKPLSRTGALRRKRRRGTYGWPLTVLLLAVLLGMAAVLWALFISGPARIEQIERERTLETIRAEVPDVEGLERASFDYVTWQGYTSDTLYWFDRTGQTITTRPMDTLDYEAARSKAVSQYGMEPLTVTLAYGYSAPVYQLESETMILMLDYDTLEWVYERNVKT